MAISDIPEFIEVAPGELIRAENWNTIQRQMRNGLRTHHHTRAPGAPVNDASATDEATQIQTNEIADGAVTAPKLAAGAISGASLADGSVTLAKLAANSVDASKLKSNAVTASKLAFQILDSGSVSLAPNATSETEVQHDAPSTKTTIYFPTVAIGETKGNGISDVEASIVYRQSVGSNDVNVFIRLVNHGGATADLLWQVLIFAS
ncbi:MAG TPA: hypothetical protein VGJ37_11310 [Pyrinomonadaceae bacterium]|jgi:hypothetical protein